FSSFSLHGLLNLASRNQGHRPDLAVARSAPSYDQHLTFPGNTPCVVAKRKTPGIVGAESGGSGVLLRYTGYPPSRSDSPIGEEKGGAHMCRKALAKNCGCGILLLIVATLLSVGAFAQ